MLSLSPTQRGEVAQQLYERLEEIDTLFVRGILNRADMRREMTSIERSLRDLGTIPERTYLPYNGGEMRLLYIALAISFLFVKHLTLYAFYS